ncbi:hypothetical protein DE146DRAFT_778601 [Phaeosphaeria sp. MPI-PUGE-AT-0046c]|nr:hypothetical protein DE146DRAFT_778601 [Phaeosphaeria sp. MPI-PUGE-AT-0046c]
MAGIKRSRDDLLAAEIAAKPAILSFSSPHHRPAASRNGGSPTGKKLKQIDSTVYIMQEEVIQRYAKSASASVPCGTGKIKKKQDIPRASKGKAKETPLVVDRDKKMSDAPLSEKDADARSSSNPAATQPATSTRGVILPFTPLPPDLAHQVDNHKYAPSPSAAREEYLKEVRHLRLFPQCHPMQTPGSQVTVQARRAIYERYFLGMTNEECIATWNSYGGNVKSAAAISKVLLRNTGTWFAEESAVPPWMARRNDEKRNLKKLGLGPQNFPAPHATTAAPANAARVRNGTTPRNKQVTNSSNRTLGEPFKRNASRTANNGRSDASSVDANSDEGDINDDDKKEPSDSGTEYSGSERSSSATSREGEDRVPSPEEFYITFAKEDGTEPPMRALARAATNAFPFEKDPTVPLIVDSRSYTAQREYLMKHCAWVRDAVPDRLVKGIDFSGRSAVIVRAFIQAITPEHQLPEYDFDFDFDFSHERAFQGRDASNPVGAINGDRRKARKIIWNVAACIMMYDVAMAMECNLVRNLVVDQLWVLYQEEEEALRNTDRRMLKKPDLPLYLLPGFSLEKDRHIICVLGAMHINRQTSNLEVGAEFDWPDELSEELIDAVEQWADHEENNVSNTDLEWYCRRFHYHDEGEKCHIFADDKDLPTTEKMTSNVFSNPGRSRNTVR